MTPQVHSLNCPNCGGPVEIRGFAHTLSVVCPQCLSILDAKDPKFRILQQVQIKERIQPLIPLGTRGKLDGIPWEVIGFQVRTTEEDGIPDSWSEYLLFNPYRGFRYLTEYNGHWNIVRTLRLLPQPTRRTYKVLNETYVPFQSAVATTTYVLGEFPWRVRVGETAKATDYISPPRMLSAETTDAETVWSLGEYTSGTEIWKMFQPPGQPPPVYGTFANQPSPSRASMHGIWTVCLNLLSATVVLALLWYLIAPKQDIFRHQYGFSPSSTAEASFVTEPFDVKGHPSNLEISVHTNLDNNWAYFHYALINEATGQAYDFGREVSRYHGRDGDGAWAEGSAGDRAVVPSVQPGRYYLRVEPEMEAQATPVMYDLRVRRGVPSMGLFLIAALLLLVPPAMTTWRTLAFEQRRWQESNMKTAGGGV